MNVLPKRVFLVDELFIIYIFILKKKGLLVHAWYCIVETGFARFLRTGCSFVS